MPRFELIATTTFGLESVVSRELENLGYKDLRVLDGKVHFSGDERDIARCNLWLRSADRLLIKVGEFPAPDFGLLFDQTVDLPWADYIPVDAKFPVAGRSVQSRLHAVPSIQASVKKAIVESLKKKYNRFRFEETGAEFPVEVSLLRDVATLTIDTSGEGLHKRGYREFAGPAPLRETMAAGLIQLSYWNRDRQFVDPFCGSGTLAIEAALIGRNIAPGAGRSFLAEDWPWMDRKMWKDVRNEARDLRQTRLSEPIFGFDHDPQAIRLCERSASEAGVSGDIQFRIQEVSELRTSREYGVIVCNPPYGERMGDPKEVEAVYRELGRVCDSLPTWSVYVITSNTWFEKHFGRRAPRRRKLYNGRLECQFYQYLGPAPPKERGEVAGEAPGSEEVLSETSEPVSIAKPIAKTVEQKPVEQKPVEQKSSDQPWMENNWVEHTQILLNSFRQFVGRDLIRRTGDPIQEARKVFEAPYVVVSHGTQEDPVLNYGNKTALELWEMDIPTLTSMPSRLTAEPMHRDERAQLMARAARDGFVDDYRGIRISSTGKRFAIEEAIIWNLVNDEGTRVGQAATFSDWKPL
jgi:putative N6-adenine-specific DNA methylase